jgi:hypothetical protein
LTAALLEGVPSVPTTITSVRMVPPAVVPPSIVRPVDTA